MICPRCGSPDESKRFCTRCGQELHRTQAPVPMAEARGAGIVRPSPAWMRQGEAEDALIGRTLDRRYRLEARIGLGGMGTVYRASRLLIGDTAAVKVLHPEQVADPRAVERFRREAQAAARLKHPNAVTIYDFGISEEKLMYIVMELVEGENLRRIITQQGSLTQVAAAEVISQVCAVLDEAHRHNVVHRDLKPENIIVQTTPSGWRVKVLDFGIATLRDLTADRLTQTGNLVGTPHYMSPEQCLGEELDGRSDIYSLGIVLYEMLTGVLPFDSPTPTAVVVQQVNQAPPPLRALNKSISPAVEAVVLRALEKRREARPGTAGALAQELLAAASGVAAVPSQPAPVVLTSGSAIASALAPTIIVAAPAQSSTVTPPDAATAVKPTSKLVPLLIGLLLALAAGIGLGLWWYLQKNSTEPAATEAVAPAVNQPAATAPLAKGDRPTAGAPSTNPTPPAETKSPVPGNRLWEVIRDQTSSANDVENALGEPDQKAAAIVPGGQLALAYLAGQFFGDGPGADLRVYGPAEERVSYLIFVRDDPTGAWQRVDINRRGFPQGAAGHDIGHHRVQRARQVMIKNEGQTELHIDAVAAVYKETIGSPQGQHRHH